MTQRETHRTIRARQTSRRARLLLLGAAATATVAYRRDPGFRRARAAARKALRRAGRSGRTTALHGFGRAKGVVHGMQPHRKHEPLDDVTLTHKVESVLFRDPQIPKGKLSINAENGSVFLRGQLDDEEQIDRVAAAARKVPDVGDVVNLLHLPGTDAPHPPPRLAPQARERSAT